MKFDANRIKKRRQERLRRLQEKMERSDTFDDPNPSGSYKQSTYSRYLSDEWERPPWETNPFDKMDEVNRTRWNRYRRLIQILVSVLLLSFVYFIFHFQAPLAAPVRDFVSEVMNRSFNFDGVAYWYKERVGDSPAFLPTLAKKQDVLSPNAGQIDYVTPVKGTVISPFYKDGQGIILGTEKNSEVAAIDEGWIIFAGEKEGLGATIVIRHQQGVESWYAHLDKMMIQKDDWVQPGQTIATISDEEEKSTLYFALKDNNQFVDPIEVISFD